MANVGKHKLQRAFVINLDHLRYQLRSESGSTESTSMQEAWLLPRLLCEPGNVNNLVPDQNDLFSKIWAQVKHGSSKMGSYGMHGDAQRESLCLIEEAKSFAKVVKADDAEVPTHLWNNQVS
jgi:hypothetical protein